MTTNAHYSLFSLVFIFSKTRFVWPMETSNCVPTERLQAGKDYQGNLRRVRYSYSCYK